MLSLPCEQLTDINKNFSQDSKDGVTVQTGRPI